MPTLWFSYSDGGHDITTADEPLNSPYTITWHVGRFLQSYAHNAGYDFCYVNLDSVEPVEFGANDIAIGHVWDTPGSFMQQALTANIKAKIVLQPYSHGMVSAGDVQRYIDLFMKADALLFVTGDYWYDTMKASPFAALYPKVTRVDMAVNTELHPYSKTVWNKPGERAVCVIGHDIPTKGYRHVAELARVAGFRLGHFGSANEATFEHVPSMTFHGGHLFTPEIIQAVCAEYDALIALPTADANPTVLLEAAAWGLAVFCSQEAGYLPGHPFRELRRPGPMVDTAQAMAFNVVQMRAFQHESEYDLRAESTRLRRKIETDYRFDRMCAAIWSKVSEFI